MQRQVFIIKGSDRYYLEYINNHTSEWQNHIISILTQNDFEFMLSHFEIMKIQTNIEALPYYYMFPSYGVEFVEIRVQLIKHKDFYYTLDLNLGSYRLSEMTQLDFEELLRDLTMLQTREEGSKVYFQPAFDGPRNIFGLTK